MGTVVEKIQCPKCLDSGRDNLVVYSDGEGSHCFACGYHDHGDSADQPKETNTGKTNSELFQGICKDIPERGLSKKTCQFFNYQVKGKYQIANYCDGTGKPVAQKIRRDDKKFMVRGDSSKMTLFGQHLYEANDRVFVTVCEGEIDALSVAESQGTQFPVVSIPNGANNATKALKNSIEWLSKFKHVVLMYDMDEAGQAAARACVELLEPGKIKIAKLSLKDPNEMILAGKGQELRSALFNAKSPDTESLLSIDDILDIPLNPPTMGMSWGFPRLDKISYGIQLGGVYIITAGSGVGKTTFMRDVIANLIINEDCKVVMCSLEQPLTDIRLRMAGYVLNKQIHRPGDGFDIKEVNDIERNIFNGKLFVHDNSGEELKPENIYRRMRAYAIATGCKVILLDNITQLVMGASEERKAIDIIMSSAQRLSVELNIVIFIVSQLSKPEGKGYEEGRKISSSALRGSQSLQTNAFFVLAIEGDTSDNSAEGRNVRYIRALKDRYTGEAVGKGLYLKYDSVTGRMVEHTPLNNLEEII